MNANTLLGVGLALAVLVQPGCNRDNGSNRDPVTTTIAPEKSAAGRSAGSGAPRMERVEKPPAKPASVSLPAGTALVVRTTTALSTKTQEAGETFTAHLEQPLVLDGREIFPKGTEVEGRIVESDKGGRVKGRATLSVQLTRLDTAGGRGIQISTGTHTREANATKRKDAAKVGIGSGIGAAIGAIAGGGRGAAIGAAAGAGAGTGAVLVTYGDSAAIPSETVLRFALSSSVNVSGSR